MNTLVAEVGLVHGSGFEIIDGIYQMSAGTRLNAVKAAQLLYDGSLEKVICSGRGPVQGDNYGSTEAQLMADFLVGAGFASGQIEIEDRSTSTIGNWTKSAPIIEDLDAESVMGITARVNKGRMQLIGDFIADRSTFELVGYSSSEQKNKAKDYAREFIGRNTTRRFLAANLETPIDSLDEAYEKYKTQLGLAALKRFVHRGAAAPSTS